MTRPQQLERWGVWALGVAGAMWVAGTVAVAGRIGGADAPHLLGVDIRLGQLLREGELLRAASSWWALLAPQPPAGAVLGTAATVLTGSWPLSAAVCMGITLLLVFDALVRLSLHLTSRRIGAVVAWAALLTSPFTWSSVEQYSRDLSAAAAILQAISHVAAPGALTNRRAAIGFGAWMGVAFTTKYTAPVFLMGPCLGVGLTLLRDRTAPAWKGLGVAVLAFALTGGLWYAGHLGNVQRYLFTSLDAGAMAGNAESIRDVNSLDAKVYYFATLWEALSAPGVALLFVAGALGFRNRESRLGAALLVAGGLVGVVVLARVSQQVDRYAFPSFVLFCALMVSLGRHWTFLLAAAIVFAPRGVASAWRYAPGQVGGPASYDHGLSAFSSAHWPAPALSFGPSDFSPKAWNLPAVITAAKAVQGPDGTVGVLMPGGPGSLTFGHLLLPSVAAGCAWDWATINMRGGPSAGGVMMGPLFDGTWPSSDFTTLIALEPNPPDGQVSAWLRSRPLQEQARVPTKGGGAFVIYAVGRRP